MNALAGKPLPVYGDGLQVRDWLHVDDHARAIAAILRAGRPGATYCIGGDGERTNLEIVRLVCRTLDRLRPDPAGPRERLITHVADRPGHDRRYAIDAGRIATELGWRPAHTPESGIAATVTWYLDNTAWLEVIRASRYDGARLGLQSKADARAAPVV
jgi:dTDP-glucose 4,6-dehydratase